jgi:GT2 family glycosyltransferase
MKPVSVVIVNYNTREHLRACLATIQSEAPCEVVVVDNASSDHSSEMVQVVYPWVVLHANESNIGYGAAANQAVASCCAEYVLLLNSDTRLSPGALQAFRTYLELHPEVAVVGPRLVNPDGTLQASCYPFPGTLQWFLDNDIMSRLMRYVPVLRNYLFRTWPHSQARVVPAVKGAALAIRRDAFEAIGGFDASFFLYFEELDLCYRLNASGWQVHFAPVTDVIHFGGASTMQYPTEMAIQFFAGLMHFLQLHYAGIRLTGSVMLSKSIEVGKLIYQIIHFYMTQDACQRSRIAKDIAARRLILHGDWKEQDARRGHPEINGVKENS